MPYDQYGNIVRPSGSGDRPPSLPTATDILAACDAFLSADTKEQLDQCEAAWDSTISQATPDTIRAAYVLASEPRNPEEGQPCPAN